MQRQAVKSAFRTFEVLELFAQRRMPMPLHEIYTALRYPQSSTTNLLKSMVLLGYLNYNRKERTYLPTMRINALGTWLAEARTLLPCVAGTACWLANFGPAVWDACFADMAEFSFGRRRLSGSAP